MKILLSLIFVLVLSLNTHAQDNEDYVRNDGRSQSEYLKAKAKEIAKGIHKYYYRLYWRNDNQRSDNYRWKKRLEIDRTLELRRSKKRPNVDENSGSVLSELERLKLHGSKEQKLKYIKDRMHELNPLDVVKLFEFFNLPLQGF